MPKTILRAFLRVERRIAAITPAWAAARHAEWRAARRGRQPKTPKGPRKLPNADGYDPRKPSLSVRLLEAAAKVAEPGGVVNIAELARSIGVKPSDAYARITFLRADGKFPYRNASKRKGAPESCES